MDKNSKILFMGRSDCRYTEKILKFLKKKTKYIKIFLTKSISTKPSKNILSWKGDYIFCFRSYYILKKRLIKNAKLAAINFHPGLPAYRGIGCVNFAIYNNEKKYGATAYIISEKVDKGKILDVKRFKIKKNDTVNTILKKTYNLQVSQALRIMKNLNLNGKYIKKLLLKSSNEKWSRKLYKRSDLNSLYKIKLKFSKKKIDRIIRATNTKLFKPYIEILNYKFFYNE